MKTKNITLLIILSFFITSSESCFGMNYIRDSYNTTISMITTNMAKTRDWASGFITRCRNVGILATFYGTIGKYDFKRVTGLDENKLSTYNSSELKNALDRINTMIKYGGWSQQLIDILNKVQAQYQQTLSDEEIAAEEKKMQEEADFSYDQEKTIKDIEEIMRTQKTGN